MSNKDRINRVITRSGDQGETSLADGSRYKKSDTVIQALGEVDELNAALGVLVGKCPDFQDVIEELQQQLFNIGAEIALPGHITITDNCVLWVEDKAQQLNEQLPPLKEFILPGGSDAGAWCHYCRTIARRTERTLTSLNLVVSQNQHSLAWLNRLSDLLFILARSINQKTGSAESLWQQKQ